MVLFTTLLFYIFALILVLSALAVISSRNTVHSVMFLILAFVNAAGLFIMLKAEFLAMLLIIVYVGAIAVLFLFVVMMLNSDNIKEKLLKKHFWLNSLIALIIATELIIIAAISEDKSASLPKISNLAIDNNITNTEHIGNVLYTNFVFPFQISGLILFVAMIGAIVLTIRNKDRIIKKQFVPDQINRNRKDSVKLFKPKSGQGLEL